MSNDTPHRLKIAFTLDGAGVNLWSNDRTLYFSFPMWNELLHMAAEMHRTQAQHMANFEEPEPTRIAPIQQDHEMWGESRRKATLEDLA